MQTPDLIISEINVNLWKEVLISAINDISPATFPHYQVIQHIINYILNAYGDTDYGLIEELFERLLKYHPPLSRDDYYDKILGEPFVKVSDEGNEKNPFVWFVINEILPLLEADEEIIEISASQSSLYDQLKKRKFDQTEFSTLLTRIDVKYLRTLPLSDKLDRLFLALEYIVRIFEGNNNLFKPLFWPNQSFYGKLTPNVLKIVRVFFKAAKCREEQRSTAQRLLCCTAELIRNCQETLELGPQCFQLSKAVEILLRGHEDPKFILKLVTCDWLKLLICSQMLGELTESYCPPELQTVLACLEVIHEQNNNPSLSPKKYRKKYCMSKADPAFIKELGTLRNTSYIYAIGYTRLQHICRSNNLSKLLAILHNSDLDLNLSDNLGNTPLMIAIKKNSIECIRALLNNIPSNFNVKKVWDETKEPVNVTLRNSEGFTALMLAAMDDNLEICHLLLSYAGPDILKESLEGRKGMDFPENPEIKSFLRECDKGFKMDYSVLKKHLKISRSSLPVIWELCYEFITSYINFCNSFGDSDKKNTARDILEKIRQLSNNVGYEKNIPLFCDLILHQ